MSLGYFPGPGRISASERMVWVESGNLVQVLESSLDGVHFKSSFMCRNAELVKMRWMKCLADKSLVCDAVDGHLLHARGCVVVIVRVVVVVAVAVGRRDTTH